MANENLKNLYDVVVIGGGPAGLTAAIYLARARYRVIVVEKEQFGGQIAITSEVVNYPGVEQTNGKALTETMRKQAENFGAEFTLAEVSRLELEDDVKKVHTSRGILECFGVLLATGAHPRMVGFLGEAEFRGHGVAYCATCDGEFFTGMEVFVVGGGFAAAEESVFLTKYASHVTILIRKEDFTCAKAVAEAAKNHPKITVLTNTVVDEVMGKETLKSIRYHNTKTGVVSTYTAPEGKTFGVFVFVGYAPATELIKGIAELNEQGYVITDQSQKTSVDGLYAAGDVCVKNLRQVVTAVGDGALAATELERYVQLCQKKTGLKPELPALKKEESKEEKSVNLPKQAVSDSNLFTADMLAQLNTVFKRMETPLILKLYLDNRPVSAELKRYMEELATLTDKVTVSVEVSESEKYLPVVKVCAKDGSYKGLAFHGVPGGHEFTSFVLGLYNAAGSGQAVDSEIKRQILALDKSIQLKILVSLSCTMCPELVMSAQKIASMNDNVSAEVFDLNHYPSLKEQYHVMSVPCMVMNDSKITFGKKNMQQLLNWIQSNR
ncbi:MAG: FAD-dependent oxidoreductase [Lachnospiraceae bacterium]